MKRIMVLVLALIMVFAALSVFGANADALPEITYTDHLTNNSDVGYDYDITNAAIAWVKQANGTLIWVADGDARTDDEIIAQVKEADASIKNENAVLRGIGTAVTPNSNGARATVTVAVIDGKTLLTIDGKYSHFVGGYYSVIEPDQPEATEQPVVEGEVAQIRIDTPLKMAVVFEDGSVYYGGEMKDFVIGQEYLFQMCAVNWDNGIFDGVDNGIRGTVVYRMIAVHQNEFNELATAAQSDADRYTVKGIDIIDNVEKKIIVNCDAVDARLETDVNNFFMVYRFSVNGENYNKKTGIDGVINTPVESLSVNLPLGSTIACKLYNGEELIDNADILIVNNSGEGVYDDEFLTSVNDFVWGSQADNVK